MKAKYLSKAGQRPVFLLALLIFANFQANLMAWLDGRD
jgi:hypothetical protein